MMGYEYGLYCVEIAEADQLNCSLVLMDFDEIQRVKDDLAILCRPWTM